jgi:hypothetical protein
MGFGDKVAAGLRKKMQPVTIKPSAQARDVRRTVLSEAKSFKRGSLLLSSNGARVTNPIKTMAASNVSRQRRFENHEGCGCGIIFTFSRRYTPHGQERDDQEGEAPAESIW